MFCDHATKGIGALPPVIKQQFGEGKDGAGKGRVKGDPTSR
jgi:hypothetical protein